MNLAIAVSMLMIGGVTLPGMDDTISVPDLQGPEQSVPQAEEPARQQTPAPGPYSPYFPSRAQQTSRQRPQMIPVAPTSPDVGHGSYPFTPPTAPSPGTSQAGAPMQGGGSAMGYPSFLPPTATGQPGAAYGQAPRPEARPFGLLSPLSTSLQSPATPPVGQQGYRLDFSYPGESVAGSPLYTPGPVSQMSSPVNNKPFSQYRGAPAVSPYLNLFRDDTNFGRVDNYNTLVRPLVEQRNANLQVGGAIHGLERSSQTQGSAINRLGGRAPAAPTQRFMNYQNYFGGSR